MKSKHIIQSLPLLASVLGRKYGVEVRIGGSVAYTTGQIIQIPSLPASGDNTLLGLVRGYIDHESAHIRHTDFEQVKAASMTPLEQHVWNVIEDWRVENQLATIYPGCKDNFLWLIRHLFVGKPTGGRSRNINVAICILNWLLITVRSWDVPELSKQRAKLATKVEATFPTLLSKVEPLIEQIPVRCIDTWESIVMARELIEIIQNYATINTAQQPQPTLEIMGLNMLLNAGEAALPNDISQQIQQQLRIEVRKSTPSIKVEVAIPALRPSAFLTAQDVTIAMRATTALRTRLQAFLQSSVNTGSQPSSHGRLDTCKLHRLAFGDAKVFRQSTKRQGLSTAIHVLLDASGSMGGGAIRLGGMSCFALATALDKIRGVSIGVSAFPGNSVQTLEGRTSWNSVSPILQHGAPVSKSQFGINTNGSTPIGPAIWWVVQQMHRLPENRKIILLVTDGEADRPEQAQLAIKQAQELGYEVYGIGISTSSLGRLMPARFYRVITSINELSTAMFEMLQGALVQARS